MGSRVPVLNSKQLSDRRKNQSLNEFIVRHLVDAKYSIVLGDWPDPLALAIQLVEVFTVVVGESVRPHDHTLQLPNFVELLNIPVVIPLVQN